MEVTIKTAEEFEAQYVRVEIKADRAEVPELVSRVFDNKKVIHVEAATLNAIDVISSNRIKELESQVKYLRDLIADDHHRSALQIDEVANPLRAQIKELESENQRLARQVCEFDRDRTTERDRANQAESALEHHAKTHRESLDTRQKLVAQARSRVSHARIALSTDAVEKARHTPLTPNENVLSEAIGNALAALEA